MEYNKIVNKSMPIIYLTQTTGPIDTNTYTYKHKEVHKKLHYPIKSVLYVLFLCEVVPK